MFRRKVSVKYKEARIGYRSRSRGEPGHRTGTAGCAVRRRAAETCSLRLTSFPQKGTPPLSDAARGFEASLAQRSNGPCEVVEKLSQCTYRLKHGATGQQLCSIDMNNMKRFFPLEDSAEVGPDAEFSSINSSESLPHRCNLRRRTKRGAITQRTCSTNLVTISTDIFSNLLIMSQQCVLLSVRRA